MEYIGKDDSNIRIGAILGLGIAYAGSQQEEVEISAYCLAVSLIGYMFLINMIC